MGHPSDVRGCAIYLDLTATLQPLQVIQVTAQVVLSRTHCCISTTAGYPFDGNYFLQWASIEGSIFSKMVTVRTTIVSDSSTDERPSIDRPAVIVADLPEDVGTAGGDADPDTEQVKAADFLCNCKLSNGTPSSTRHSVKELLASRSQEAIHVMPQVVLSRTLRYTPIVVLSKISLLHCCISTTM